MPGITYRKKGAIYVRGVSGGDLLDGVARKGIEFESGRLRDDMGADEVDALIRHAYDAGKSEGKPTKRGRPSNADRAAAILTANPLLLRQVLDGVPLVPLGTQPQVFQPTPGDNPKGWPTWTPDEAIRATLDSMPDGNTKDGYASALNIQADALGRETFETWVDRWWDWLYREYPNENTQQNHISAANKMLKHARSNAVRKFVPNFKRVEDRPQRTKAAKRKARRLKKDAKAYTPGEMVGLTNTALLFQGGGHYSTLVENVCAFAGLHIGDALVMLGGWSSNGRAGEMGCEHCDGRGNIEGIGGRIVDCPECEDWGFEWDGPHGVAWWNGYRVKTGERIRIPLAPSLTKLLKPLAFGRGLKYEGKSGRGTSGRLPKSTMQYRTVHEAIETKAGVRRIKGQSFKRYRTGFHRVLRNVLRLPKPVRKCLLAHRINDGKEGATGAYDAALKQELVDAILAYEKVILEAKPERTAEGEAA